MADFWRLTLRQYEAYIEAHDMWMKEADRLNWLHGMYVISAVGFVGSKLLGGKNAEYIDSPLLEKEKERRQSLDEEFLENPENITPEERKRRAMELFAQLHVFSANVQLKKLREKLAADRKDGDNG